MQRHKTLSRRTLLRFAGYSAAALPLALLAPGLAYGQAKTTKDAAKYQDHPNNGQMCASCQHFVAPHSCKLVQGNISPKGWCTLYAPKQG